MPSTCAVGGCTRSATKNPEVSFFRFPRNPAASKEWVKFVNNTRKDFTLTKWSLICSAHFTGDCRDSSSQVKESFGLDTKYRLKQGSVPTLKASNIERRQVSTTGSSSAESSLSARDSERRHGRGEPNVQAQHLRRERRYGKQSSGDLQSRLKTRKLLGVGECEDGSVPVSKISQILGNDDHYLLTLPNGLRLWQVATSLVFTVVAFLAIMFPVPLFDAIFASSCGPDAILPIRLFGAALTCLGLLFWSAVKSVSRYIIRWTLLSQVLYLSIQATIMLCTLIGNLSFNFSSVLVLLVVVMAIIISFYFYAILSGYNAKWLWKPKMVVYNMPLDKAD